MIDRDAELSIKRQALLLGISRGSVYYHPEPVGARQGSCRLVYAASG
jgi:putative transposase